MTDVISSLYSSLFQMFDPATFGLMLLGIGIGFAVGILPGLGGPTTLALMLPFIVKMKAVEAFAFLLGMAAVTNTTGDLTSILLGVPGEPTTAATIVDGHPMAKKGEAGRAMGAALASSLVGSIFGAFTLALIIPIIRPMVLLFGSPEFFMLAILGITFVASLSGKAMLKGFISGGIGLLLSTIGLAQMAGVQRYTFDQVFLWDGIGLVPITIGFFAIPELIDLAVQRSSIAREEVGRVGGVMEGIRDTFRHWKLVIRCSAIGTFTSIIPGLGASTTQWLAYAHAMQSSPNPERFGKGAIEGVLGPGAANNATLGGSLVTTVGFGVPSSVLTAVLLGAFIIQGLVPGPDMLLPEQRGGHLALTFSFVWTMVFSNIITVLICLIFLNALVKVTRIRSSLLIPFILILIYLGAFAEKNMLEDLLLVAFFGALGWVMQELDWPRPPLILGLVLGPLAENRLFLSIDNYGWAWLLRPGVLALVFLTLIGVFYPIWKTFREKKKAPPGSAASPSPAGLRFDRTMIFTAVIALATIGALWESRRFDLRAGLFPWAIGIPVLAMTVAQFIGEMKGRLGSAAIDEPVVPGSVRRKAAIVAWTLSFLGGIWILGFKCACPLFTFLYLKTDAREKWAFSILLAVVAWAFVYGIFDRALAVPFPPGLLMERLFGQ